MGLLLDTFGSTTEYVALKERSQSLMHDRREMVLHGVEEDGGKFNVPISQLGLAKMERALRTSYFQGNAFNTDKLLTEHGRDIYEDMLEDGHCFSVVEDLTGSAAAMPRTFQPADDKNAEYREHAAFIEECFGRFNYIDGLKEVAYFEPMGISLTEKVYSETFLFHGKRKQGIKALERVDNSQIVISVFDQPKIVTQRNPDGVSAIPFKYVFARRGSGYYGSPLLKHAFRAYWYKKNCMLWIARFIQRYGDPAIIAYHDNPDQELKNMQMLEALMSGSIASLPANNKDLTVLSQNSDPNFVTLLTFYDDEMSKVVLSGTRQSSGSADAGAYSATEIHEENADDRKDLLALKLNVIINTQIIPGLIDFNYGPQLSYPKAKLGRERRQSPKEYTEVLIGIKNSGFAPKISKTEFHEKTGLAMPTGPEDEMSMVEAAGFGGFGGFGMLPPPGPSAAPAPEPKEEAPAPIAEKPAEGVAAEGQDVEIEKDVVLNGAQITAAVAIITSVADGSIPRDSGLELIQAGFNMKPERAKRIMGSAGTNRPTTPNPRPADAGGTENFQEGGPMNSPTTSPKTNSSEPSNYSGSLTTSSRRRWKGSQP